MRQRGQLGAASRHGRGTDDSEPDGLRPEELPPLVDHADAKAWLDTLGRAVATGRLRERPAQAAIRAVSEWVKAHGEELVAEDVERLRDRLETLEGELQRRDRPWE